MEGRRNRRHVRSGRRDGSRRCPGGLRGDGGERKKGQRVPQVKRGEAAGAQRRPPGHGGGRFQDKRRCDTRGQILPRRYLRGQGYRSRFPQPRQGRGRPYCHGEDIRQRQDNRGGRVQRGPSAALRGTDASGGRQQGQERLGRPRDGRRHRGRRLREGRRPVRFSILCRPGQGRKAYRGYRIGFHVSSRGGRVRQGRHDGRGCREEGLRLHRYREEAGRGGTSQRRAPGQEVSYGAVGHRGYDTEAERFICCTRSRSVPTPTTLWTNRR